jgi:hypothetical protein
MGCRGSVSRADSAVRIQMSIESHESFPRRSTHSSYGSQSTWHTCESVPGEQRYVGMKTRHRFAKWQVDHPGDGIVAE